MKIVQVDWIDSVTEGGWVYKEAKNEGGIIGFERTGLPVSSNFDDGNRNFNRYDLEAVGLAAQLESLETDLLVQGFDANLQSLDLVEDVGRDQDVGTLVAEPPEEVQHPRPHHRRSRNAFHSHPFREWLRRLAQPRFLAAMPCRLRSSGPSTCFTSSSVMKEKASSIPTSSK